MFTLKYMSLCVNTEMNNFTRLGSKKEIKDITLLSLQ